MRGLRVNGGQGTAGLPPFILRTHIHTTEHNHTAQGCRRGLAKGPTLSETERKEDETIRPVQSPITLQTQMAYRREVIIWSSLVGLKATRDPRRDHLHSWHTWPGYTSYGYAVGADLASL